MNPHLELSTIISSKMLTETQSRSTGKERDSETGLDNFGKRYFGSNMGRFMSPDPIGIMKQKLLDPQQWNMYAYARDNPLRFVDPTGMYNTDCKEADIRKCSATIQTFEANRQKNLQSQDARVRASAQALGGFNDGNKINLRIDPSAKAGSERQDRNAKGKPLDTMTITLPPDMLDQSSVAHAGSHAADFNTAVNGGKPITRWRGEIKAYQTQAATLLDSFALFSPFAFMSFKDPSSGDSMVLMQPFDDTADEVNLDSIKIFLATDPRYNLTEQNQGGFMYVQP